VLVKAGEQGDANLLGIEVASGKLDPITKGRHELMSYTADAAGRMVAFATKAHDVQRRPLLAADDERAGGDVVHEL
jgi:hypothetical protein